MSKRPRRKPECWTSALVQDLKNGKIGPDTLSKAMRQQCVEVFWTEGYSIAAMAQILHRCEKTISRDLDDIHTRNSLTADPKWAKKMIGEYVAKMRIHSAHLMRLARSNKSDASVSEKAQAEYYAAQADTAMMAKLESLGYLDAAQQLVDGQITSKANPPKVPVINVIGVPVKPRVEEPKND